MSQRNKTSDAASTTRTRIVLCGLPRLLAAIIRDAIVQHPDLELVDEPIDHDAPWDDPRAVTADVVLQGSGNGEDPSTARKFLYAAPRARVLQLAARGADAYVYQLQPTRSFLGELSAQELVDAIRSKPPGDLAWVDEVEV